MSLCHRCEWRLRWLEKGTHAPRFECYARVVRKIGDDIIGGVQLDSVNSCYMFRPIKPIIVERNDIDLPKKDKDKRPLMPGMASCRFHMKKEAEDVELVIKHLDKNSAMLIWKEKE